MEIERCEKDLSNLKGKWQYMHHKLGLLQESLVRLLGLFLLYCLFLWQVGCSSTARIFSPPPTMSEQVGYVAQEVSKAGSELAILSWVGGISTLAGIASIVITRGMMGMRAIIIGVGLIVLNFAVANYLSWILVPVLVGTGLISLAWSYKTIKEIVDNKE